MIGFSGGKGETIDGFIIEELRDNLFQSPGFAKGLDLVALNIHRARDHGTGSKLTNEENKISDPSLIGPDARRAHICNRAIFKL